VHAYEHMTVVAVLLLTVTVSVNVIENGTIADIDAMVPAIVSVRRVLAVIGFLIVWRHAEVEFRSNKGGAVQSLV